MKNMLTRPRRFIERGWLIRLALVIIGLVVWHWTQQVIGTRPPLPEDAQRITGMLLTTGDRLLTLTTPLHTFLQHNEGWTNVLLIVSSAVIDLLGGFLLFRSIFGSSIRPFVGLLILFSLRQISLALTALPPPDGMIWHYPGFPSLLVTYSVANDLFFSGHTALAVYGAIELARLRRPWFLVLGILIAFFEIMTVLSLRGHYTMDVFAGVITALWAAGIAQWVAPHIDRIIQRFSR